MSVHVDVFFQKHPKQKDVVIQAARDRHTGRGNKERNTSLEGKKDSDIKVEILNSYPQWFHGSGNLPGVHTIVLQDDAAAVIHTPCRVAVA